MDMSNPVTSLASPAAAAASIATNAQATAALDSLKNHLPDLFALLVRKINVAQIVAKTGQVGDISIGEIAIGDVVVDSLKLTDTSANLTSGSAFLQDVAMTLELRFRLEWWIDIEIYEDEGVEDLPTLWFSMNVGNVQVPSLDDIEMDIPEVTVSNLSANVAPIKNLDLGPAGFTKLKVDDLTLPSAGFSLAGLALGTLNLSGLGAPEVKAAKAGIDEFTPTHTVVLPAANVQGISIPSTSIPNVSSGNFGLDAQASSRALKVDFDIFGFRFVVTPIVHMHINAMTLQGLALSADVGQVSVQNARLPVNVKNIVLKSLKLDDVSLSDISL
jgi:hypothetical protein